MVGPEQSPQINCPQCGASLEAGLPACPVCGAALAGEPGAPPGPPANAPFTAPPPVYPTYVYPPPPGVAPPTAPPILVAPPAPAPPPRRTGLWVGLGLVLVLVLCLISFGGVGAFVAFNGGRLFVAPTPTPIDPTALLDEANAAQSQTKSLHYMMTGDLTSASGQPSGQLALDGDVVPPDSYTMHSDGVGDRIVVGPDVYTRQQGSTTWEKNQPDSGQQTDPTNNPTALLDFLKFYNPDSVALQDDVISGTQRLRKVRFEIDVDRMAASQGAGSTGAALLGADVQGTVQIDATTHLIDRLTLLISAPNNGSATLTLVLSRYNVPVIITPPANKDQ